MVPVSSHAAPMLRTAASLTLALALCLLAPRGGEAAVDPRAPAPGAVDERSDDQVSGSRSAPDEAVRAGNPAALTAAADSRRPGTPLGGAAAAARPTPVRPAPRALRRAPPRPCGARPLCERLPYRATAPSPAG